MDMTFLLSSITLMINSIKSFKLSKKQKLRINNSLKDLILCKIISFFLKNNKIFFLMIMNQNKIIYWKNSINYTINAWIKKNSVLRLLRVKPK
jgi:hypothetical protein